MKVEVHVVLCFTFPRVVPRELQNIELPDQYELRMRDGGSVAAATSAELETDVAGEGVPGESSSCDLWVRFFRYLTCGRALENLGGSHGGVGNGSYLNSVW